MPPPSVTCSNQPNLPAGPGVQPVPSTLLCGSSSGLCWLPGLQRDTEKWRGLVAFSLENSAWDRRDMATLVPSMERQSSGGAGQRDQLPVLPGSLLIRRLGASHRPTNLPPLECPHGKNIPVIICLQVFGGNQMRICATGHIVN